MRLNPFAVSLLLAFHINAGAQTHEVPLEKTSSNLFSLPIAINGHDTTFILDSGATLVSISQDYRDKLMKNGLLKVDDFTGNKLSIKISSGEFITGDEFIIKELKIGDVTLRNVIGNVKLTEKQDTPLLIGQSVLNRFKSYSINMNKMTFELQPENIQNFYHDISLAKKIILGEKLDETSNEYINLMSKHVDGEQIQTLEPDLKEAYISHYAYCLYNTEKYRQAEKYFKNLYKEYNKVEYQFFYAFCLHFTERREEAKAIFHQIAMIENDQKEVWMSLLMLCENYFIEKNEEKFWTFANKLKGILLKIHNTNEETLTTGVHKIEHLGYLYYMMAITERDNWNCETAVYYKTISENLGYRPEQED